MGILDGEAGDCLVRPPSKSLVAELCFKSYKDLKSRMIMNACRHGGDYGFFPVEELEDKEDNTSTDSNTSRSISSTR